MRALPMRTTFSSFLFSPFSLSISVSVSSSPSYWRQTFFDSKSTPLSRKKLCFLWTELELAARGGTRKPLRRATRKRRPMDVHVFVSLTQRLGFGHQSGPKFPFGKPHDQKSKKKSPPSLKRQSIFASTIYMFFCLKERRSLTPSSPPGAEKHVLTRDACKP